MTTRRRSVSEAVAAKLASGPRPERSYGWMSRMRSLVPASSAPSSGSRWTGRLVGTLCVALTLATAVIGTIGFYRLGAALGVPTFTGLVVFLYSAVAGCAAVSAWLSMRRSTGLQRRVWMLIALGVSSWALSCVPYLTFLALGGDPTHPAVWTQAGYLLAYPFWYYALWMLRQPVLAESRRARVQGIVVELVALGLAAAVVGGLLWFPFLGWAQNVALLAPAVLDLLLVAGIYNAVRRTPLHQLGAQVWLGLGFITLLVADVTVNYLAPRGLYEYLGIAIAGYAVAMSLLAYAATRPIRPTEMRAALGRSRATIAVLALGLIPAALLVLPTDWRPELLGLGVLLVLGCWTLIKSQGEIDSDPTTGFLTQGAFERHLGGLVQGASERRPVMVALVELNDFGDWVAEHGFRAADELVERVAERVQHTAPDQGVWGRVGSGRIAWAGIVRDLPAGRALAEGIRRAAGEELDARVAVALMPQDAENADNLLVAAEEALAAAAGAKRTLVAFDRGMLDGAPATSGYTASLRQRRAKVEELLNVPGLLYPVFQPILAIEDLAVQGYEALSRFSAEPARGPDVWIQEANSVGLGIELEAECLRRALTWRAGLPAGTWMSLNVSPRLAISPLLDAALGSGPLDDIVLEITEHDQVEDYAQLAARLALYRGRGARIAIDDAGAGHSSLRHVMQLRPELVKLDPSLIRGLETDTAQRALVGSLVAMNAEIGADLVAEGVEMPSELEALRSLGVQLGQGYLFARPDTGFARLDKLSGPLPEAAHGDL